MTETLKTLLVSSYLAYKQHLLPASRLADVAQVTRDIVALHATDPTGPYLSLWARVPEARSGIVATLIVPPQFPSLPPLVGEAVYRVVHESLSNVRKHAHASAVMVSLHHDRDSVTVTVQDNGVGLAEPLPLEADDHDLHFGVATMRQLATQAQGDFFIGDNDDQGVMVKARFPMPGAYT